MYLFLWVAISVSSSVSLFGNSLVDVFFETLVILSAILLPIKSPVGSAVFDHIYCLHFYPNDKNPYPFTYILAIGSIEYLIFIRFKATSVFKHVIDFSFNYHS